MDSAFFDYNDAVHTGPYKLIRTVEEYWEAVKADHFIGSAWCFEHPRRIESTELISYMGEVKVDYYGKEQIENIDFQLKIPRIPWSLFNNGVIADFKRHTDIERILQIRYDVLAKEYVIVAPTSFKSSKVSIDYDFSDVPHHLKKVLEVHSHNTMPAYFSRIDDNDELVHGLYAVVGTLDTTPTIKLRVGMEGFFTEVPLDRLFDMEN